jgi:hypothetical protein
MIVTLDCRFLTFATSVLQNKKVEVVLRADRLNLFSDIASEDQTAVYGTVKTLKFQGILYWLFYSVSEHLTFPL